MLYTQLKVLVTAELVFANSEINKMKNRMLKTATIPIHDLNKFDFIDKNVNYFEMDKCSTVFLTNLN